MRNLLFDFRLLFFTLLRNLVQIRQETEEERGENTSCGQAEATFAWGLVSFCGRSTGEVLACFGAKEISLPPYRFTSHLMCVRRAGKKERKKKIQIWRKLKK